MKLYIIIFLLSSVLFANESGTHLTQLEKEWITQHKEISFTGDPNWLPFEAFDKHGNYIGIVSDYLDHIEQETGISFLSKPVKNWSESLKLATEGKVSLISGDVADKILNQNFKPIEPYIINPIIIVMSHHVNYVEDLNTLRGKKIAIIKDYGYTSDIFSHYPNIKFIEVENIQTGLRGVSSGKFDAMLASSSLASYAISSMGFEEIKIVGKTTVIMEVTLFIDKNQPILYNIINKTIKAISIKDRQKILTKWTSTQTDRQIPNIILISVLCLLVILVLAFFVHIRTTLQKSKKHLAYMKKLESAQELGHMGSWEWDMISGNLIWSDEVYRIFGEEPQSFPATYEAFVSYIPTEYLKGLESAIETATNTHTPYEYDHQIRQKDGSIRFVREAGYVRYNDKDEPISMLGTVLDIDSVIQVQTTKRENKELSDLLKKYDDNVIASNTDLKGIITYASKAFVHISGYSLDELIGKPQNIVRHQDTPSQTFTVLWQTIKNGKTWRGNLKNKRKDGSYYWVDSTISPLYDENNKVIGYSSIRRDITHEKLAQELHTALETKSIELQKLNNELENRIHDAVVESKAKDHLLAQQSKLASMGEMIGNIAHQWRQPLNALSILLQKQQVFHERGLLTLEKTQESVRKGTILINKMSSTIDDFRDFFKPSKQKVIFDIKHAIDNTLELIDAALYNKNIKLNITVDEGNKIFGYENEFSQVILNIINNARDVLVEKNIAQGEITIQTYTIDGVIHLQICDNAGGIPDNYLNKVFEPYFTTKDEGQGTGIGLYMSKMIIEENMGGSIRAENRDKGACFIISFTLNNTSTNTEDVL